MSPFPASFHSFDFVAIVIPARSICRGDEWSLRAFASMPSTAIFLRARVEIKNLLCELARNAKIGEHEQASTRLNFASKLSKGKILRPVKNFNEPFITPICVKCVFSLS